MSIHSPSFHRQMGTGPELRQGDQEEEAKEKHEDYLSRKNKGFRRRHARSRAGRTPDLKTDLLSLSNSLLRINFTKKGSSCEASTF